MKQFDPPLKVGDKIAMNDGEWTVTHVAHNVADVSRRSVDRAIILADEEGRYWRRIKPLAVGDEVVLIERRPGVVREVSGETAIIGDVAAAPANSLVPIELSAEGRDWERAKE